MEEKQSYEASEQALADLRGELLEEQDWQQMTTVGRVTFGPGDVLVVQCAGVLRDEQLARIQAQLQQVFPDNRSLVLDADMSLTVMAVQK